MITGIFGNLSAGKTVTAVMLIVKEVHKNPHMHIISNTKLKLPMTKKMHLSPHFKVSHVNMDELYGLIKTNPMFYKDSLLMIDEVHNLIDARRSSSRLNQEFTQFATQLGKLDCNLILTSQMFESQVDLRIRELMDVLLFCLKYDEKGRPIITTKRKTDGKIFIKVKGIIKLFGGARIKEFDFMFDPRPYYDYYDTHEIILIDREKYKVKPYADYNRFVE